MAVRLLLMAVTHLLPVNHYLMLNIINNYQSNCLYWLPRFF